MQKSIIYITVADKNWLRGLEYFVQEFQLGFNVLQYETVEEVLNLSETKSINIYAIILDWDLSTRGLHQEAAIECLELTFPFIPVLGLSATEFKEHVYTSTVKNKFTTHPEQLFTDIQTFIHYYKKEWLRLPANSIFYSVQVLSSNLDTIHNHESILFHDKDPLISRQKAIDYFKKTERSFQITLHAYNVTDDELLVYEEKFAGLLHIYSAVLLDREILADLNAEYLLYVNNNISVENKTQTICLHGSGFHFKVLSGIVDDKGRKSIGIK